MYRYQRQLNFTQFIVNLELTTTVSTPNSKLHHRQIRWIEPCRPHLVDTVQMYIDVAIFQARFAFKVAVTEGRQTEGRLCLFDYLSEDYISGLIQNNYNENIL